MTATTQQTLDLTPDPGLSRTIERAKPVTVSRSHWWHVWSPWGAVFSSTTAGIAGMINGGKSGPWWQERTCVRCQMAVLRRVEARADR